MYLALKNKYYDYKDIKLKFTPNIPQDDVSAAQIIQQLGDKLPLDVALSLLSFIENPQATAKKAKEEQQSMIEDIPNHNDTTTNNNNDNMMKNKNTNMMNSGGNNE
jgi:hypothetical protein